MAYVQTRQVTAGEMITGSFEQLAAIKRELAIYFFAFLAAGAVADVLEFLRGPISFAAFVGYFVAQYCLYRAALGKAGIMFDSRFKGFSFFAMALILSVPILFGLNFLVVPGLLLGAKWVMAPTFLVSEERNLFEAIGDSWSASSGNTLPLTLAFAALCAIWLGGVVVIGALTSGFTGALSGIGLGGAGDAANTFQLLSMHLLPVMLMGLSVAAYRALGEQENSLAAVFE